MRQYVRKKKMSLSVNWTVYYCQPGKSKMPKMACGMTEQQARALVSKLNRELNKEEGVPQTSPYPFYFASAKWGK